MMQPSRIIGMVCLTTISMPLLAANIQCKLIPHTATKQCVMSGKSTKKIYGMINMPYALCSKAACTIQHKSSKTASCACALYATQGWTSVSLSPTPYSQAKPTYTAKNKLKTVQSNYSLANTAGDPHSKMIDCHYNEPRPWANCFGARCTVTGSNTATCLCPVYKNKKFVIGPGNKRKCDTKPLHLWSGILKTGASNNVIFINALYEKNYPNKNGGVKGKQTNANFF